MARCFASSASKPGDRVAVLLDRGLDCYVTLLGLLKARAAYVPIDANHPADRLAYILRRLECAAGGRASALRRPLSRRASGRRARPRALPDRRPARRAARRRGPRRRRRPALLRALHLRHDRAAEGRRGRASVDLQFRPRRRRDLRLWPRRPRLSGHVGRLRLLRRGALGAAGRGRDAGAQRLGQQPVRRGTRRIPGEPARSPASAACRRCSPRSSATCPACACC